MFFFDTDDSRTAIRRVFELMENIVMFLDGENKICRLTCHAITSYVYYRLSTNPVLTTYTLG